MYDTEKLMTEHADKLDDESKTVIESSIEKVNAALAADDMEAITSSLAELEQATHALSKHMYDAAQEAEAAGGDGSSPEAESDASGDEEVIDAEFEAKE